MAYNPNNPNGQATSADSTPIVISSNQTAIPITVASLPIPSGAATSALQTTGNTSLNTIATNTPALGQALAAASIPVVLTTAQLTILTPVSTVTANAGTNLNTSALALDATLTGGTQKTKLIDTGGTNVAIISAGGALKVDASATTQPVSATQSGTWTVQPGNTANTTAWKVDGSAVTQPISAASLPLPTTASTSTLQSSVQGSVAAGTSATNSNLIGGVYNTALPALTNTQQAAIQLDSSGRQIMVNPGTPTALGQATSANSQSVVIASDQSAINEMAPDLLVTGQSAQTATVNNILTVASGSAATNLTGYKSASVQVVSTGSGGTFIFEGSNDNASWITLPVFNQLILTGTPITAAVTATSSQIIYSFPVTAQYVRLRIATTITGGSIQAFSKFMQATYSPAVMQVAQTTAANLATTATIASGTVTTVTTLANGQTAHSAASTGSPVRVAGRVITTQDTTLAQGEASDMAITTGQQLVTKEFGTSENDWQATSSTTPLAVATSTQVKAAAGASIRNFVSAAQFYNNSATVSTTVSILDGATVLWTGFLPATTAALPVVAVEVNFPTPLRGTAATAMNIQLGTTLSSVYYNVQGFTGF